MQNELLDMDCRQLRDRIAAKTVKSLEATEAVFEAMGQYERAIGAYLSTFREQAVEKAVEVDKRIAAGEPVGPLAGVPVAIKDVMCTTFGTTTCASRILEHFQAPYNATPGIQRGFPEEAVGVRRRRWQGGYVSRRWARTPVAQFVNRHPFAGWWD